MEFKIKVSNLLLIGSRRNIGGDITMDGKPFPVEKEFPNYFGSAIDIDGAEKSKLRCFQRIFVSNNPIKKFVETIKYCWRTELNAQQFFEIIHELIRLKSPQSSQRTQSIAKLIFATFAFFAVRFLCYSNGSQDADIKGLQKNNIAKLISQNFQQICVHLCSSAVFFLKFDILILSKGLGTCSYSE